MENGEPTIWEEYIGQEQAKRAAIIAIEGAKRRGERLDHILIYGPSGIGKTTMARLIADGDMEETYGQNFDSRVFLPTIKDVVRNSFFAVSVGVVNKEIGSNFLFIEEIHTVPKEIQEETLELLDKSERTIIGATTRPDLIIPPLRNRFLIQLRLDFYSPEEIATITKEYASFLGASITEQGLAEIAKRSRGIPRTAKTLLKRVRDYGNNLDHNIVKEMLSLIGVDEYGLNVDERNYVMAIALNDGGPVSLSTISAQLSVETKVIATTERYPLRCGLVEITTRGRKLTKEGESYVRKIAQGQ